VLLTGALGFTGKFVEKSLVQSGFYVIGIGNKESFKDNYFQVDLLDISSLKKIVSFVRPDYVIHLAGIAFVESKMPNLFYEVNLIGTRNLLSCIATLSDSPKKVILASSANIYGHQVPGSIKESAVPNPVNDYAISKYSMELIAKLWSNEFPITIARPFNYTGLGQTNHFVIPKIVSHFINKSPMLELGNLQVCRDFSDVRTVAEIYVALLQDKLSDFKVVNICSGRSISLNYIISLCERYSNYRPNVSVNPKYVRSNEIEELYGSTDYLYSLLPSISPIPIEETIKWMLCSSDNNP
jgi:nucleoside-diphosphate-sugar epimerase